MKIYKVYKNWYCAHTKIKGRIYIGFGFNHYQAIINALKS